MNKVITERMKVYEYKSGILREEDVVNELEYEVVTSKNKNVKL